MLIQHNYKILTIFPVEKLKFGGISTLLNQNKVFRYVRVDHYRFIWNSILLSINWWIIAPPTDTHVTHRARPRLLKPYIPIHAHYHSASLCAFVIICVAARCSWRRFTNKGPHRQLVHPFQLLFCCSLPFVLPNAPLWVPLMTFRSSFSSSSR